MRPAALVLAGLAAVALGACKPAAAGRAANAADDVDVSAARIRPATTELPERAYACRIWNPTYAGPMLETQEEDRPYGTLTITGKAYSLALEGGKTHEGIYRLAPDRSLEWVGQLGPITLSPRHVTGSRFTTYDDVLNLVFDFEPPTEGPVPHRQVICRAKR